MSRWSCLRMNILPLTLGVVFFMGLILCFIIAVTRGDVSPYLPFISETGGKYPEAGIFSLFLYFGSLLGYTTIFVRFLIVRELNSCIDQGIDALNKSSIAIGAIALTGMTVVASFPMTTVGTAHDIGANVLFVGAVIYAILQTWMSYKMSPYYTGRTICHIRLGITILSGIALIALLALMPLALNMWNSTNHFHWTGSKSPDDEGFALMVGGAVAEWSMAILFVAYYFTFVNEFGRVSLHLQVVPHTDEEPCNVTERTPIVM